MKNVVVEGVDRLGKDTLINNLQKRYGHCIVNHFAKPIITDEIEADENIICKPQEAQKRSFKLGFDLLRSGIPTIFNRFHLGEYVYGPMYRFYNADYIWHLEDKYFCNTHYNERTLLVLLTTTDFSFIKDDGNSFDFSKKVHEQALFIEAFHKSKFQNKIMIDVHNGKGSFKDPQQIINEVAAAIEAQDEK